LAHGESFAACRLTSIAVIHVRPGPAVPDGRFVHGVAMRTAVFFDWCGKRGLTKVKSISENFRLSSQTVRNWRKLLEEGKDRELELWVDLACVALDSESARKRAKELYPKMGASDLLSWERKHGFQTYEHTGDVFRIKRQAVHNWHKRQSFPKWLPLACAGYDIVTAGKAPGWFVENWEEPVLLRPEALPRWIVVACSSGIRPGGKDSSRAA